MSGATLSFGGGTWSPDEQQARAARLAGGLITLGLREGDTVAVLLRNGLEYADVIHACRIAGIHYCPLNWHLAAEEICYIVADCGAGALIGNGDLLGSAVGVLDAGLPLLGVGAATGAVIEYAAWLGRQATYAGPLVAPRAHIGYTSGTTGRPKGVVRSPLPVAAQAAATRRVDRVVTAAFGVRAGARVLIPAPLYHSAVSLMMQHALQRADDVLLLERFDAEEVLCAIATHEIDTVYLVPIMYVRLLALPQAVRAKYDLSSLRFVASTGAPCPPAVKAAMIDWLGPVIHESYASTECGIVTVIGADEALARPGSAGRPIDEARIAIYAESGQPCAAGVPGLVYCRQPAWPDFTYRGLPDARRSIERNGMITLGDIGYVDDDGYLFICDRASDMVISGGVNIYPAEIEGRLLGLSGVADCAVFGVPDDEYGERLHAIVELAAGSDLTADVVVAWARQGLAGFKVPRTIEFRALPRDDNGKIVKRQLRATYWQGRDRRV